MEEVDGKMEKKKRKRKEKRKVKGRGATERQGLGRGVENQCVTVTHDAAEARARTARVTDSKIRRVRMQSFEGTKQDKGERRQAKGCHNFQKGANYTGICKKERKLFGK